MTSPLLRSLVTSELSTNVTAGYKDNAGYDVRIKSVQSMEGGVSTGTKCLIRERNFLRSVRVVRSCMAICGELKQKINSLENISRLSTIPHCCIQTQSKTTLAKVRLFCPGCPKYKTTFLGDSLQGQIFSPSENGHYPNNARCSWNIQVDPSRTIQLVIVGKELNNLHRVLFHDRFNRSMFSNTFIIRGQHHKAPHTLSPKERYNFQRPLSNFVADFQTQQDKDILFIFQPGTTTALYSFSGPYLGESFVLVHQSDFACC